MPIRSFVCLFIGALAAWPCALTAATAGPGPANLLVVGDSLSAAYGLRQEEGWVELLRQRIRRDNLNYTVVNASISGETTAGGASRIAALLDRHRPAFVIIALGGNDGLRGTPLATMRSQLAAMLRASRGRKASVVLVGMDLPPNYGVDYAHGFTESFAALSREYRVALVPSLVEGFGERRDLFQADGMHPVASAQTLMLENVWRVLGPLLGASGKTGASRQAPGLTHGDAGVPRFHHTDPAGAA